jgi:hypothetical protein
MALPPIAFQAAAAGEPPTIEMIRERMQAIGIRSVSSADGHLVVSGPDSFRNAMLLAQAGDVRQRVQLVVGMPLSFDARSVRVLVNPDPAGNAAPLVLDHAMSGGIWIHRVVLTDYASIETRNGMEALCAAFLALYLTPPEHANNPSASFVVPAWLRQGVLQVLTEDDHSRTLEQAIRLWREGRLPSPVAILADETPLAPDEDADGRLRAARGAFFLWLTDRSHGTKAISTVFQHLSKGHDTNEQWLRDQVANGGDPHALWNRWMRDQGQVIRSLGRLTLAHMEALQAEWCVQPGTDGIPADITLPADADGTSLLQYRDRPWFVTAIRQKRYRIEMLAQGRPENFRRLTAAYVSVLNAIETGEPPPTVVVGMAVSARQQWQALHEMVSQAGGVWSEP